MPGTLTISCPQCGKAFAVPAEVAGKRVRCKSCQTVVTVPAAGAAPAPPVARAVPVRAVPAARPADAPIPFKPEAPAPAVAAKPPPAADDEDDDPNPYGVIKDDLDVPRCPFCASELDSPEATVCKECGYNLTERRRHESKKVYELTFGDYAAHVGPAIACVIVVIGVLALDIYCFLNMRDWLTGSFLDEQSKSEITGTQNFIVPPYCFNLWIGVMSAFVCWVSGKFAFKRLVYNSRPTERIKK